MKKSNQKRVLVVEDEEAVRHALREKLTHEGLSVLEAKDGEEGLTMAAQEQPDIILLDLHLPKVDGIDLLRVLRKDTAWGAHVPVIVLTNLNEPDRIMQAIEHGVSQYLVKSDWKIEDVVIRTKELLAKNA